MPQYPNPQSWKLEGAGGGHVVDVETAVKDGILGGIAGGAVAPAAEKLALNKMIEDLDPVDEIPAVFICPISLEPMTDPVTLCTGQTYERANILKWFSFGNLTCPTTMQELWDDAVTPNRTLQQLIHAWFSQKYLRMKKRAEDVNGRAADIVNSLRNAKGQARVQALKDLRGLVTSHASTRKTVVCSNGVVLISSLLGPFTSHAVGSEAIGILVHLSLDSDSKANLMQPAKISLVSDLLNEGTTDTKINCTKFLEMLMEQKDFRPEVVASLSLLVGIVRLAKDRRHPNGVLAGISVLRAVCRHTQVRGLVVSVGAVPQIGELLPELSTECVEPALQILDDLSTLPEGQSALKECPQMIPNLVRVLMRVSEACTQSALSVLWAVCRLDPGECGRIAVDAGLAAKLLLVIQSGCDQALKQRSAELLKLCSLNYTATHFISKCKQGPKKMKRTRATDPITGMAPSKIHKKPKEPINPKPRNRKPHGAAAAHEAKEEHGGDQPGAEGQQQQNLLGVDVGLGFGEAGEGGFGLWCGSVEEELLLGWFPWAGPIWEEEEEGREYGDIWQLQHIHEIPNPLK